MFLILAKAAVYALEMPISTVPPLLLRWQDCPCSGYRPELVQNVDVLLRIVALMLVPEDACFEVEHHIAPLIVGPLLIHLYDAVDGHMREVLVFDDELVISDLQA